MDTLVKTLAFPSSALLAILFLLVVFVIHHYAGDTKIIKIFKKANTALCLLAIGAVLLAVEGTWSLPIHHSVPFFVYILIFMFVLFLTVLEGIKRKAKLGFIFNHLGIFLIMWASTFGAPDVVKSKIVVGKEQAVNVAYTSNGMVVPLPFDVQLHEFSIDYYADSIHPKQFTSKLIIDGEKMQTSVNHPCTYKGYTIYQDSYDSMEGAYSVLQVVNNPWLPLVLFGMLLLAMGSVLLLLGKWKVKVIIPVMLILTIVFTIFTVAKINFEILMPALRSWWFVPHLFLYMVAYSLMAMALVLKLLESFPRFQHYSNMTDGLMRSSCALLIIGMLTGSVWADLAWGDYWAWDPKENWAAVTWFASLAYLHLANKYTRKSLVVILLAFLALQITWYGVNYLPSSGNSLHTYNNS